MLYDINHALLLQDYIFSGSKITSLLHSGDSGCISDETSLALGVIICFYRRYLYLNPIRCALLSSVDSNPSLFLVLSSCYALVLYNWFLKLFNLSQKGFKKERCFYKKKRKNIYILF